VFFLKTKSTASAITYLLPKRRSSYETNTSSCRRRLPHLSNNLHEKVHNVKERTIQPVNNGLNGNITIPGDKYISHSAVMFGSIAEGKTTMRGFLTGADCLSTSSCFKEMGVEMTQNGDEVSVVGKGVEGLKEPKDV
ncbi:hypothetical protein N5V62_24085, partial [Escherichia coli]|nr:hypothetical protein [Escherichia coli]